MTLPTSAEALHFLYNFITAIGGFLFVITPAIFLHELGHFIFAKRYGVKVFTFSVGFGHKLWSRTWGGTEYCISAIPLGGYVKMAGEDPGEEKTGAPDEFWSKPVWQRSIIILAGPVTNIILGFILFCGLAYFDLRTASFLPKIGAIDKSSPAIGRLQVGDTIRSINGRDIATWSEIEEIVRQSRDLPLKMVVQRDSLVFETTVTPQKIRYARPLEGLEKLQVQAEERLLGDGTLVMAAWVDPVIGELLEDDPAEKAGLQPGDKLLSIGDTPIAQWGEFVEVVRASGGETLVFTFQRGSEIFTKPIQPESAFDQEMDDGSITHFYAIGAAAVMKPESRRLDHAILMGTFASLRWARLIVITLEKLVTGKLSLKLMSGPVGIAQGSGVQFRQGGLSSLINFLAIISINLGVVNLFPFPLLDGGFLFIFFPYEKIFRRPMPTKVLERVMQAGMALLLVLVLFITYNDLKRILGFTSAKEILQEEKKK